MHPDVLSLLFRPLRIQRSRIFCRQNRHSLTYPQTKTEVLSSPLDVLILWLEYLIRNSWDRVTLFWTIIETNCRGKILVEGLHCLQEVGTPHHICYWDWGPLSHRGKKNCERKDSKHCHPRQPWPKLFVFLHHFCCVNIVNILSNKCCFEKHPKEEEQQ